MSVSKIQAERIAHLARLRLDEEELARITSDLNHILEHVESLEGLGSEGRSGHLDTGGAPTVAECASTRDEAADEPHALEKEIGASAPDWREGFFVVPPLPGIHEEEQT